MTDQKEPGSKHCFDGAGNPIECAPDAEEGVDFAQHEYEIEDKPFIDWQIHDDDIYSKAQEALNGYNNLQLEQSTDLELLYESASEVWGLLLDLTQGAGAGVETRDGLEAAGHAEAVATDMICYWTLQKRISERITYLETDGQG